MAVGVMGIVLIVLLIFIIETLVLSILRELDRAIGRRNVRAWRDMSHISKSSYQESIFPLRHCLLSQTEGGERVVYP